MPRTAQKQNGLIALLAAVTLALQFFLTGWATGAMPGASGIDVFGNPLCISGEDHGGSDPPADNSHLPTCCLLGCSAAASPLLTPDGGDVALARPLVFSHLLVAPRKDISVETPDYRPGNARAPPAAA